MLLSETALGNPIISGDSSHWTPGWTDSSFQQSDSSWTAFTQDSSDERRGVTEQWWPTSALEESRDRVLTNQNLVRWSSSLRWPSWKQCVEIPHTDLFQSHCISMRILWWTLSSYHLDQNWVNELEITRFECLVMAAVKSAYDVECILRVPCASYYWKKNVGMCAYIIEWLQRP